MVERLKRLLKKYAPRVGIFLLSAMMLAYLFYHCFDMSKIRIKTTHAVESSENEVAGLTGYIFRDEHPVTSSNGGAAIYRVSDGEKVSVATELARVYTTGNTEEYVARRDALEDEIEIIRRSIAMKRSATSIAKTRDAIKSTYASLMASTARGENEKAKKYFEELSVYLNAYDYIVGKTDLDAVLAEKEAELAFFVDSYSGVYESISNSKSGYFYYGSDGYESIFDYSSIESLTLGELDGMVGKMESAEKTDDQSIGRMIYDFEWYIAIPASAELCGKLKESGVYEMNFTYSRLTLDMTLERIAIMPGESEGLLIFISGELPEDFDFEREQSVELLVSTTVGYRIPREALRESKGFKGV